MKFCDKLVKQRKDNNMSQEQLAELLGISRQAISKWESGNSIPDMAKILELCKILNCNLEDLVDDGVGSNKEVLSNKIDFNNYLKEILDFITRTVNMFWSMRFIEKIKCITEILFISITLFIIWGISGNIINSIFYNILNILPSRFYEIIRSICSVIYGLFGLISGIIIVIHIFKIRYLDYFITIEDSNVTNKTLEEPIDQDNNPLSNDKEIKFIDKKKNRIIIRDPKHSTYTFFTFLGKIILLIIKFILLLITIPCIFSFVALTFALTTTSILIKDGLFFLGISITISGVILLNFIILKFIYNFILNQKSNFKKIFIILILGLLLSGIGLGISFIDYLSFEEKTITNNDIEYTEKTFNIEMNDKISLNFLEHDQTEIIIDNNREDIKLEITYQKNGDISLDSYISNYYIDGVYKQTYNYEINYHEKRLGINFIKTTNYLIEQIKNKEIFNNEYDTITKIKVYINNNNLDKLKNNN